jgi:hypothetical protein
MGVIMQAATDAPAGKPQPESQSRPTKSANHGGGPFSMNFRTNLYTDNLDADTIHQALTLLLAIAALVNVRGGA